MSSVRSYSTSNPQKKTCYKKCTYTSSGSCPAGYTEGLTPCGDGYTYTKTTITRTYSSSVSGCNKPSETITCGKCTCAYYLDSTKYSDNCSSGYSRSTTSCGSGYTLKQETGKTLTTTYTYKSSASACSSYTTTSTSSISCGKCEVNKIYFQVQRAYDGSNGNGFSYDVKLSSPAPENVTCRIYGHGYWLFTSQEGNREFVKVTNIGPSIVTISVGKTEVTGNLHYKEVGCMISGETRTKCGKGSLESYITLVDLSGTYCESASGNVDIILNSTWEDWAEKEWDAFDAAEDEISSIVPDVNNTDWSNNYFHPYVRREKPSNY